MGADVKYGLRHYLKTVLVLHVWFRKAEYPMGSVQSWVEAFKFALVWK